MFSYRELTNTWREKVEDNWESSPIVQFGTLLARIAVWPILIISIVLTYYLLTPSDE